MSDVVEIRVEITSIKGMVVELPKSTIVSDPLRKTTIPIIEVPNIWIVPVDKQTVQTEAERVENKRKKNEKRQDPPRKPDIVVVRMYRTKRWLTDLVD